MCYDSCEVRTEFVEESWPPLSSSGQSSWLQNGNVLCFMWGTNWIYMCYVEESRLPLWSSSQNSWLQNGNVLCFLWGTNRIYIRVCYVEESWQPLWSSDQGSWLQNGNVLCFMWGTNWIYICCVEESRPVCGLVVRVPGYRTEMFCVLCEVPMNLYMLCRRK
jgi:hypothetical protein